MKYTTLKINDTVNCDEGICVSLWTAGCPHRCPGCFNSETWEYENGISVPADIKGQIIKAISANGIQRNFSVLGGEPLVDFNLTFVKDIVAAVRTAYPNIKIFLWTGYTLEVLQDKRKKDDRLNSIMNTIDVLIDGPFIQEKKDITLKLRGSSNQRINYRKIDF